MMSYGRSSGNRRPGLVALGCCEWSVWVPSRVWDGGLSGRAVIGVGGRRFAKQEEVRRIRNFMDFAHLTEVILYDTAKNKR